MKVAYTISTANFLSLAKTVGDSFLKYNPDYEFIIFLYDKIDERFDVEYFSPIKITEIESLFLPAFNDMVNRYSIFEMCNALKPFVAEHILLNNENIDTLVYTDSDLMFYDSIAVIENALQNAGIIITPHVITPMPLDGFLPDEKVILNAGLYNGGFFALKPSPETFKFLNWWKTRLELYCFIDFCQGLFVDQIWINFVPLYYKAAFILEHPGYNIGIWNLYERVLENRNGKTFVNSDYPLIFYHFSGYDISTPANISKYQNRFTFESRPDLTAMFENYTSTVIQNNYEQFYEMSCYYSDLKQKAKEIAKVKEEAEAIPITITTVSKKKTFKLKMKSTLRNILHLND